MVSKVELQVLFILFERSDIHLIPLALASLQLCTSGPVERYSVSARVGIANTYPRGQVLASCHTQVNPFAVYCCQHIAFDSFYHFSTSLDGQLLIHSASHRALKSGLYQQSSCATAVVNHMEVISKVTSSNQIFAEHFIDMLTCGQIEFLVEVQHRSIANKTVVFARRWRQHYYFLNAQCKRLICSQFHEDKVIVQELHEHASELIFLLCTSSDCPVLLNDSTRWTVKTHVEAYGSRSRTFVFNYELELIAISFHLGQVQVEPLFTFLH